MGPHRDSGGVDAGELKTEIKVLADYLMRVAASRNQSVGLSQLEIQALKRVRKRAGRARSAAKLARARTSLIELIEKLGGDPSVAADGTDTSPPGGFRFVEPPARADHKALKIRVAEAQLRGLSAREALELHGVAEKFAERTARFWRKRLEEGGTEALADRRKFNGAEPRVLTEEVCDVLHDLWRRHRAATITWIHREAAKTLKKKGITPPSLSSVRSYVNNRPVGEKVQRIGGSKAVQQSLLSTIRVARASAPNQEWRGDIQELDVWVKEYRDGEWRPVSVKVVLFIDCYSRAIPGFFMTTDSPTADSVKRSLLRCFLRDPDPEWVVHGLPDRILADHGSEFIAKGLAAGLRELGISYSHTPPQYPQENGIIERLFRTLDTGCIRALDGTKKIGRSEGSAQRRLNNGQLITKAQLEIIVRNWIIDIYHTSVHSETGEPPIDRWVQSVSIRRLHREDIPLNLLPHTIKRTVQRTGIRITVDGQKRVYWAPALQSHVKETVLVRHNPDAPKRIWVYDLEEKTVLCEADTEFSIDEIKAARKRYRTVMRDAIEGAPRTHPTSSPPPTDLAGSELDPSQRGHEMPEGTQDDPSDPVDEIASRIRSKLRRPNSNP